VTLKRVVPREQAKQDVNEAIDHCLQEDAEQAALRLVDDLEKAYSHLSRQSASGSPRYAHELGLPGLRFWPLTRFPYLVFYFEHGDVVDVWRVLHAKRDIPAWMSESGE
jgi:toxin ParE1/3/4